MIALASVAPVATPVGVVLVCAGAYLIGAIPVGWIVGRVAGVDLRQVGTGKIGTSNLFHTVGLLPAALVGPLQFCQGLVPVMVALLLRAPAWIAAAAGLCAVLGNGWPIFLQYNGGRGVASATGAVALWSWWGIGFVLLLVILGGAARRSAVTVLIAFAGLPVVLWLTHDSAAYAITAVGILICLVLRRFEGYQRGPGEPGRTPDSLLTRVLFDRPPRQAPLTTQPIDSKS